jgi:hypothetical protein
VNCCVCPAATEAVVGDTLTLRRTADVTVSRAVPEMSPEVAVIVEAPVVTPVARPWEPEALEIVAVAVTDEDHVTELVRFCVVRLE